MELVWYFEIKKILDVIQYMHLIYALCPTQDDLKVAETYWSTVSKYVKPILLPQTPYLESFAYKGLLMERYSEWKDVSFIGCIAHNAYQKQPLLRHMDNIISSAIEKQHDFIGLMYRGDPLIETAEKWHPGFTSCWKLFWDISLGVSDPNVMDDSKSVSFYCNYFACTPSLMYDYCCMMSRVSTLIDDPSSVLRKYMYQNSSYQDRGSDIAKIPPQHRLTLWGVEYYPMLPFVLERVPCLYFPYIKKCRMMLVR